MNKVIRAAHNHPNAVTLGAEPTLGRRYEGAACPMEMKLRMHITPCSGRSWVQRLMPRQINRPRHCIDPTVCSGVAEDVAIKYIREAS